MAKWRRLLVQCKAHNFVLFFCQCSHIRTIWYFKVSHSHVFMGKGSWSCRYWVFGRFNQRSTNTWEDLSPFFVRFKSSVPQHVQYVGECNNGKFNRAFMKSYYRDTIPDTVNTIHCTLQYEMYMYSRCGQRISEPTRERALHAYCDYRKYPRGRKRQDL